MLHWLTNLLFLYVILSVPLSLIDKMLFNLLRKKWDTFSANHKSEWIIFLAFSHVVLMVGITFAMYQPEFTDFCETTHQFCIGAIFAKINLASVNSFNYLFLFLLSLLFIFRIKNIFGKRTEPIPLISARLYENKLKGFLSELEIDNLQVLDTVEIFAYCKGIFKPSVYVSRGLIESLDSRQIHIVLFHEKAHLKRGDLLISRLFTFLSAFEGFLKPISYYFSLWKKERENACDDEVAKIYSPILVADTILQIVSKSYSAPAHVLNFADKKGVLERIERLTKYNYEDTKKSIVFIFSWLFLFLFVSTLFYPHMIHCALDKTIMVFTGEFVNPFHHMPSM